MTDKTNERKKNKRSNYRILQFFSSFQKMWFRHCVQKEQSKLSNRLSLNERGKPTKFNGIDLNEFKGIA